MSELEAAGDGMRLAQVLLNAKADRDDRAALDAINTSTEAASKWALSYMTSAVVEAIDVMVDHKPVRLALALRAAATGVDIDIFDNQLQLLSNEFDGLT